MVKQIRKRDGRIVPFDGSKITNAILKAMKETELGEDSWLANKIADEISNIDDDLTVEFIQDKVEEALMASDRKDVAKKYIIYRDNRSKARQMRSELFAKIEQKVSGSNIENSNANVDEMSFGGRKQEASSILQKELALEKLMSKDIADAHINGYIYQHDLDSYAVGMHNCLNIDFQKVFHDGFRTRNGDVRPPHSFSTACQLVAVVFQCQSQTQFGGVGAVHLDTDLAPFVKMSFKKHYQHYFEDVLGMSEEEAKDNCQVTEINYGEISLDNTRIDSTARYFATKQLEREGKQAAQGLFHNLNTLESRAGAQVKVA